MDYEIVWTNAAAKQLTKVPAQFRTQIAATVDALAQNPRPHNAKALQGTTGYRVRIGNFRVVYEVLDEIRVVEVIRVGDRKDVYRDI